jgi:hypothetical protein
MPFSQSLLHAAQPLVDMCVAYDPSEEDYIRNVFFPRKNVQHLTDKIRAVGEGRHPPPVRSRRVGRR